MATSCAILAAIREQRARTCRARCSAAGHSLGEYSALVAAGALSLEDAVRLVRARGRAMQEAVPAGHGAMSADHGRRAGAARGALRAGGAGRGGRAPANFNAPGQIVIAGHAGAVARLGELVDRREGPAIPLKVSAPFHCALMAPAARAVEAELARIVGAGRRAFPIVANVDARPNVDAGARRRSSSSARSTAPSAGTRRVRLMAAEGVTHALEIGPGKVLAGLVKRIAKEIKVLSVGDAASLAQVPAFLAEASG